MIPEEHKQHQNAVCTGVLLLTDSSLTDNCKYLTGLILSFVSCLFDWPECNTAENNKFQSDSFNSIEFEWYAQFPVQPSTLIVGQVNITATYRNTTYN